MWDEDIVHLAKFWYNRCRFYRMAHMISAQKYMRNDRYLSIPTILFQTVISSISFSGENTAEYASYSIGAIAMGTAILTALKDYLKYSKMETQHRQSYHGYSRVTRLIEKELVLQRSGLETMDQKKFINDLCAQLELLSNDSPEIDEEILDKVKSMEISNQDNEIINRLNMSMEMDRITMKQIKRDDLQRVSEFLNTREDSRKPPRNNVDMDMRPRMALSPSEPIQLGPVVLA